MARASQCARVRGWVLSADGRYPHIFCGSVMSTSSPGGWEHCWLAWGWKTQPHCPTPLPSRTRHSTCLEHCAQGWFP